MRLSILVLLTVGCAVAAPIPITAEVNGVLFTIGCTPTGHNDDCLYLDPCDGHTYLGATSAQLHPVFFSETCE